ncbi:unnamed protein product [Rotaria magnacalcarata]|uniref:CRAL-TRIO domain-containing protein n=1 Tax=Rotaria magnacalcarata TaxID=392030 RepID=A0A815PEV8_9BILA|nr:unnamed protein product [Rotaria magnacalcarata]CAF4903862.1 unnamed protein product [Rotaria magnacalcarata]
MRFALIVSNAAVARPALRLNAQNFHMGRTLLVAAPVHGTLGRKVTFSRNFAIAVTYVHVKNHIKGQYSEESAELLTIFTIEMSQKLLEAEIETATIVLYLEGFSMKNIDYQLIKFSIHLFENH